ncbi:MAG TPA: CHAT domain-containing protein [Leptolyngbyaceae cyanobacterium M33_DOE_097]|uniref:CHAT domain-containing protein n=1 Tax=Oscillatoriales cyanobacterium SpSt-418 TaxID=2282169 RepID=A0A7C3KEP5_9CYAN|nr:CHAT domain-containing protein [Leptolyngbyaceae cyanobacterium M33_DOE_097]
MARKRSLLFSQLPLILKLPQLRHPRQRERWIAYCLVAVLIFCCVMDLGVLRSLSATPPAVIRAQTDLLQAGKALYEDGNYAAAAKVLEQAVTELRSQGSTADLVAALTNLGSVQLELGQASAALASWQGATQIAREIRDPLSARRAQFYQSLALERMGQTRQAEEVLLSLKQQLESQPATPEKVQVLRALADLRLAVGDSSDRQPQAWLSEALSMAEALDDAIEVSATLMSQGNLATAEIRNMIRTEINNATIEINTVQIVLQKVLALIPRVEQALAVYQQAIAAYPATANTTQAQLRQMNLLISSVEALVRVRDTIQSTITDPQEREELQFYAADLQQLETGISKFSTYILALVPQIRTQLGQLPASRSWVYARINYANTIMKLKKSGGGSRTENRLLAPVLPDAAQILATAIAQARQLGDQRAESYALGSLAGLYERTGQQAEAQKLTEQALYLAQTNNAPDIAYQWQWQLGRILRKQGKREEALAAYNTALRTIEPLRKNLVANNPDLQFDFRDSVAPVYRQYVGLLLADQTDLNPAVLEDARNAIESLQLAELDNYFREACLEAREVLVDEVVDQKEAQTAVIYPIILPHQLQVIIKVPRQPLRYTSFDVASGEVEALLERLRQQLMSNSPSEIEQAKQKGDRVYQWLIAPFSEALQAAQVDTLVFVLDGAFRDVPMAALYNETTQKYLIEDYAIALSPGLKLLAPQSLANKQLNVLSAGLIDVPRQFGLQALPNVERELTTMKELGILKSPALLEQQFKSQTLETNLNADPYNVVHLATHGSFSSRREDTFILMADGKINVNQLSEILRSRELTRKEPIELLVLSACQTAQGDNRAVLGLAGVALRTGARSTLASLWTVGDASTAELMGRFYQELATTQVTKAKALQLAQLELIKSAQYNNPVSWAPYVLVGNWL